MNEDKVRVLFEEYISNPSIKIIILACDTQNKPIGLIVGAKTQMYFSDVEFAGELIWWVDEEYRRSRAAIDLFKAFEFWSKKVGAEVVTVVDTVQTTPLTNFYMRNGYHLAESVFIKELS